MSSTLAGIGLATNNSVIIVASMLVSPIMGPVLALTFGSLIHDVRLTMLGLKHELISLLMCIAIGYVIGIISICIGTEGDWPTAEMRNRGVINSLAIGFAVAIPSGVGVALSVLGNNNSSLVGVAISVSLLPPAVNCGIAFAYACFGFTFDTGALDDDNNTYSNAFSYFKLGGVSLCLTLINIGAIYVSALIMFRVKEVAPLSTQTAFWQEDIQRSRGWNDIGSAPSLPPPTIGGCSSNHVDDIEAQRDMVTSDNESSGSKRIASLRPAALELQSFETNPILQEEFLRSSIGNEVMSADPLMLALNPVASIALTPPAAGNRSPSKRLLHVLRQSSWDGNSDNNIDHETSSMKAPSGKRLIQRSTSSMTGDLASSSLSLPDYNRAAPSSVPPPVSPDRMHTNGGRPTMRRGSLSRSAQNVLGAILAERSEGAVMGDISIDEIKERLRDDAQLLSLGKAIEDRNNGDVEEGGVIVLGKSKDI